MWVRQIDLAANITRPRSLGKFQSKIKTWSLEKYPCVSEKHMLTK